MQRILINDNWEFKKLPNGDVHSPIAPESGYENVTIPHTWYQDDDQYRGLAVYRKMIKTQENWGKVFIEFCGADQNCKVYVNHILAGEHKGAYAKFRVEVPEEALKSEYLNIEVFLDNIVNQTVSPIFGDFTVFGGMYRDVNLLVTESEHFDYMYYGTNGIIVKTAVVEQNGVINIEPHVVTDHKDAVIHYVVTDQDANVVAETECNAYENAQLHVEEPHLWNGKNNTYLYQVRATLINNGHTVDQTEEQIGFRSFKMNEDTGFYLNGKNVRLNGVSKHQDFGGVYSAITKEHMQKDFELIDDIGANAVRLSHYQHMQATYEVCDKAGYIVWAEIPMLKMTENEELLENAREQLRELVLQNIHHPSIFFWGIQNEIGIFKDLPFMYEECKNLANIANTLDGTRLVTGANLYNVKFESELNNITDMIGYNIYFGWYYGVMQDYDAFLDKFHKERPHMPIGISEYGVDASPFLHSETPKVKDYSEEYQALYHETVYPIFNSKSYLWGSFIWNMFDFSSSRRNEGGIKYINQKGLVTFDREIKKDAYFYNKAMWSDQPFVHICSKRFVKRTSDKIEIKVYTNLKEATLTCGTLTMTGVNNGNGSIIFENVTLNEGSNTVTVEARNDNDGTCEVYRDSAVFEKVAEAEESYKLPDSEEGSTVKNWFLDDDTLVKEGFFSLEDCIYDITHCKEAMDVLKEFSEETHAALSRESGIPTGFALLKVLNYNKEVAAKVNMKALNDRLNQVKKTI